ncbi:MAG: FKBP-type peptidyl-prolyl cis-trans isomerase, partial [Duncaniella sp.]|nr:FKBP-type peptidyl-prolyl cis-trans isomerase [Duncaniella sp.]
PSGLVFQVITEGEGAMPQSGERVKVNYTGRLSDGTVFDQTDAPVTFDVDRLVPGFTEGLKMMRPGGTYRLVIPASLGYGDTGAAGVIPPGAALDFTVELVEVVP